MYDAPITVPGKEEPIPSSKLRMMAVVTMAKGEKGGQSIDFWVRAVIGLIDYIQMADHRARAETNTTLLEFCTCAPQHLKAGTVDPNCLAHTIIEELPSDAETIRKRRRSPLSGLKLG